MNKLELSSGIQKSRANIFRLKPKNAVKFFTFSVRLRAPLDQPDGVLGELPDGFDVLGDLVHGVGWKLKDESGSLNDD